MCIYRVAGGYIGFWIWGIIFRVWGLGFRELGEFTGVVFQIRLYVYNP